MPLTILILSLCILSSGFAGNIYKKLSVNSDSLAASLTMPSLWFVMLAVFFGILSALTGEIPDITASCDRSRAGMTVPACGLYLNRVLY